MDWDDVRHVLALARTGSVRAAGAALGVSHSTVSRRVEGLEARLGVMLFDRHRDGFSPTRAGKDVVAYAERIEREMEALERSVVGRDARLEGSVRVTCSDARIARLLLRGLAPFCAQHPGIELELGAEERSLDLAKREADVAVRAIAAAASPPEHLLGRRLVPITLCNYVASDRAAELDPGLGASASRWLGSDRVEILAALIAASSHPEVRVWGSFESMDVAIEAAAAGLGIVALPTYAGDADPRLVRLSKPDLRHVGDFWLLGHGDLRDNARLRAIRACIATTLTDCLPLFRGEAPGWCDSAPLRPVRAPSREAGEP